MTPEQIERNRAFIRDLRANPLKATDCMRGPSGERCCLCVAYDTALSKGAKLANASANLPPDELAEFYGWLHRNPMLEFQGRRYSAVALNDGVGGAPELTHAEIADAFEETFPEIKP